MSDHEMNGQADAEALREYNLKLLVENAELHNVLERRGIAIKDELQRETEKTETPAFTTAAKRYEHGVPEEHYLIDGLVPESALILHSGPPKAAGKTTFALHACRALIEGSPFMGRATVRTPVVFLSEQAPAGFFSYLANVDLDASEELYILHGHEARGMSWEALVAAAVRQARAVGARLIVLDTFAHFSDIAGDGENAAGTIADRMRPLQHAVAAHDLTILLVHHDRKGGGSVFEASRGSSALVAAVDLILNLIRPEGNHDESMRKLRTAGRYSDVPEELMIELTDTGYVERGTSGAVAAETARELALRCTPDSEADAERWKIILKAAREHDPELKKSTFHEAVKQLTARGKLAVIGEGVRGDPYRYYVPLE